MSSHHSAYSPDVLPASGDGAENWASPCVTVEDALIMHRRGWWLLPLGPKSKEPHFGLLPGRKWKPLDEQRAPEAELRRWFDLDPWLNLGVICGHGFVVVDIDKPERLPADLDLPPTWTVITGGDDGSQTRRHLYYRYDGPGKLDGKKTPWGEIKASGSYVAAAGSTHDDTGKQYYWLEGRAPADLPMAYLPTPLTELIQTPKNPRAKKRGASISPSTDTRSRGRAKRSKPKSKEATWLEAQGQRLEVVLEVMRALDVNVKRIGQAFSCPIPGHEEKNPSAKLWQEMGRPDRPIVLHDYHFQHRGTREWIPIPDVYASCRLGKEVTLTAAQRATWWVAALGEIGMVRIDVPDTQLPEDAPEAAHKLFAGFLRLLAIRRVYDPNQRAAAPYSWRFASDWCGVSSMRAIKDGMAHLLREGWLTKAERDEVDVGGGAFRPTFFKLGVAAADLLPSPPVEIGLSLVAAASS